MDIHEQLRRAKHATWKRGWVSKDRDEYCRKQRAYRARNPDKVKAWNAKRKPFSEYSPEAKKRSLERRRISARRLSGCINPSGETNRTGVCPICNREKKLVFDHDHANGKHRGWLCTGCNWRLGWWEMYKDNIEEYLRDASQCN